MHTALFEELRSKFFQSDSRSTLTIPGFLKASVLIPVLWRGNQPELLLTKRTDTVSTHKGQISFPGGLADAGDESITHTALREAEEEIGLAASHVEVLGFLDDMSTPTGFIITPVVGIVHPLPTLAINKDEVAEVLHVPLDFFHDANVRKEHRTLGGRTYEVWFYQYNEHLIWGATATIIRSLLKKLGRL